MYVSFIFGVVFQVAWVPTSVKRPPLQSPCLGPQNSWIRHCFQPFIHWATNFWTCFFYFSFLVFLDVFWCPESENDVSFFV